MRLKHEDDEACCASCKHGGECESDCEDHEASSNPGHSNPRPRQMGTALASSAAFNSSAGLRAGRRSRSTPPRAIAAPPASGRSKECRDFCGATKGSDAPDYWSCVFNCIGARSDGSMGTALLSQANPEVPIKGKCADGTWCPTKFCHCDCNSDYTKCRRVWYR